MFFKPKIIEYGQYKVKTGIHTSITEAIEAGNYPYVMDRTDLFPFNPTQPKETLLCIAKVSKSISVKDLIVILESLGYRNSTFEEFLALGEQYPNLQTKLMPIITLGVYYRPDTEKAGLYPFTYYPCLTARDSKPEEKEKYPFGVRFLSQATPFITYDRKEALADRTPESEGSRIFHKTFDAYLVVAQL